MTGIAITRRKYRREGLRYASDTTGAEQMSPRAARAPLAAVTPEQSGG
jgi:hypothetical protein